MQIALLIFCFLSVAGALSAWRKSPLDFNASSSNQTTQRIPIPDGYIADLPVLQQKLSAHCPTASVHLRST